MRTAHVTLHRSSKIYASFPGRGRRRSIVRQIT